MATTTRSAFRTLTNRGQKRKLPREFLDEMYDNFDRDTRRAVLKHYRAESNPRPGARRQADALRPHDLPALVVWGDRDPYLGLDLAEAQTQVSPAPAWSYSATAGTGLSSTTLKRSPRTCCRSCASARPLPRRRDGRQREPQIRAARAARRPDRRLDVRARRGGRARARLRPGAGAEPLRVGRPHEPRLDRRGADLPAAGRHRRVHAQRRPRPRDLLRRRHLSGGLARDGAHRVAGLRRDGRGRDPADAGARGHRPADRVHARARSASPA